jgi:hypothetical protein
MTSQTTILKRGIDAFLESSDIEASIKLGLEAYAGVQAHLTAAGSKPNDEDLQQARKLHILTRFKPIDPTDPEVQDDLEAGLTIEDLEREAAMFQNISLGGAKWAAYAISPEVHPEDEASPANEMRLKVDHLMNALQIEEGIRVGLDVIASLKAGVYNVGETPTFAKFQEYRLYEIHDCLTVEHERDKKRMLDQAAWVHFALKSAGS